MKLKNKRIISFFLSVVLVLTMIPMAAFAGSGTKVYLKPNANWTTDGARFAVYTWNDSGSSQWIDMEKADQEGYYVATVPENYSNIIFCRMNPATTENNWDNKWDQTGDLTLPTDGNNLYEIDGNSWSVYTSNEDDGSGYTVYFDTSGNSKASWSSSSSIYVYGYTGSDDSGIQKMTSAGSNFYSYTFDTQYKYVIFLNTNSWPSGSNKSSQTTNQEVPWTAYDNPTFTLTGDYDSSDGGKKKGTWSNGSGASGTTTGVFYVNTTLVDYFNNARVDEDQTSSTVQTWNQGDKTGSDYAPYSKINQWISELSGYALNGVSDSTSLNAPVPLYFGDLLHAYQANAGDGTLSWYWKGANVAFGSSDTDTEKTVAQGIVGKYLVDGNLVTSYTDSSGNAVKVPFFNEGAYTDQSNYMKFYKNLQFPFTATTINGVTTYSFDSAKDNVVYDYSKNTILQSDTVIYDVNEQAGYFPFNSSNPSADEKWKLNYGFGTQFTIPFTISKDGKDINGKDIVFSFTGDDDVWVYIDGALVLDMGGAHEKAQGTINFGTQKVEISTGASSARLGTAMKAGGRVASDSSTGDDEIQFSEIHLSDGRTLAEVMQDTSKVHTLTMYYMERGMWNSNMSISFTFSPVPSGLVVSKDINTEDVNAGLVTAVDNVDEFSFDVTATNNGSSVSFDSYTLTDHSNVSTSKTASGNKITGVKSEKYAHSFLNGGKDAFVGGTKFSIVESIEDTVFQYYTDATVWKVYDADANYKGIAEGIGSKAIFTMGSSDKESYNYSVNYINTLKVGKLTLEKVWNGSDAPAESNFEFQILLDLDGEGTAYVEQPYALAYTSSTGTKGTLSSDGKLNMAAGEKVTFDKIPAGATYTITETVPTDADWKLQSAENGTGIISADTTSAAVFTNTAKGALVLEADQIVMDYGKNIQVDILANDADEFVAAEYITATSDYAKTGDSDYSYKVGSTWTAEVVGFVNSATATALEYKTITETDNASYSIATNKKVEVQLNRFLSEVDTVYCVVKVTSGTTTKYVVNKLEVIPATNIYYENTFCGFTYTDPDTGTQEDSAWYKDTSSGGNSLQDAGTIGLNAPYGYDSSYEDDIVYSYGSVQKIVVPADTSIGGYDETYFEFTFKGEGFDLIASTGNDAATIKAEIYTADKTTKLKNATVNNVGASELNQIPVLSCEGLEYGEYYVKVQVFAAYSNTDYPALDRGSTFKFDGLRIYNPLDISNEKDGEIANTAYLEDKEAYVERLEIRDLIVGAEDFDSLTPGTDGDGMVYIDATSKYPTTSKEKATVADYKVAGPNNETYLQENSAVAFILKVSSIPESIQIGAKSINGADTTMDVALRNPKNEDTEAFLSITMEQATAQNYGTFVDEDDRVITDLSSYFAGEDGEYYAYVTISNYQGATLSITDVKATFKEKSTMGVMYNTQMANDLGISSSQTNDEIASETLKLYSAAFTTETIRYTKQATLEVVTSVGVSEVIVENESGSVMSTAVSSEVNEDGNIEWTLKFKPGTVGTRTFSVYGVDADGNVTNTESVSIEATRR